MKKRKLNDLLSKMASHSSFDGKESIISINDKIAEMFVGGMLADTKNKSCANTSNKSCTNDSCAGSKNGICSNGTCAE